MSNPMPSNVLDSTVKTPKIQLSDSGNRKSENLYLGIRFKAYLLQMILFVGIIWVVFHFALVSGTNLFNCNPNDYYGGFDPRLYSDPRELKQVVHNLIDGHKVIPYGDCDEAMEVLDANPNGQGVIGVYSLLPKHPFPDVWNREHVWPKSRGVGESGADTSDLFCLRPTDQNLNSARGNKYFDECVPGVNGCVSPAGTSSEDAAPGTSEDSYVFAPPPSMRGDLARGIFYMAVRYDGTDSSTTNLKIKECSSESTCGSNSFGRLSTLLKWHREDPVSAEEMARANGICNDYQGNRNPFVDFPDLADRLATVFDDSSKEEVIMLNSYQKNFLLVGGALTSVCLMVYLLRTRFGQHMKSEERIASVRAASL